jgi:iron(III) transport system ATP-binding protein
VSTAQLSLSTVTKRFGAHQALAGVSLEVVAGEGVVIVGPSGCGKTTMLRLIAGLEVPDGGEIWMAGRQVSAPHRSIAPPHERGIGFVFQDLALWPHLTAREHLNFVLESAKTSRASRAPRVHEVLTLVQIPQLSNRYPHELSDGEQQRVALARALAPRPAVVLLDEPFSSLDETLRAQVRADTLGVLRSSGTTAVLVTHDQTEALSVGDRVVVMHRGRVEQVDTPPRVFESPATRFVAGFMGEAVFLPAHVHDALLTCELGVVSTVPGWAHCDVDVEVVLRPHEVALEPHPDGEAFVRGIEYHGAFVLHAVELGSGRIVQSWQPHAVRHPVGTRVRASVVAGVSPTLLVGDRAVTEPPR